MLIKKKCLQGLKKLLSLCLATWLVIGMLPLSAFAESTSDWSKSVVQKMIQTYGASSDERDWWEIIALAINRVKRAEDENFIHTQVIAGSGEVIRDNEILSKSILALRALGKDPMNYHGNDLVSALGEMSIPDDVKGMSLRLAALSSDYYDYPEIETKICELIYSLYEKADGKVWYEGSEDNWQEPTGWALLALSFYYRHLETQIGELEGQWPKVYHFLQELNIRGFIEESVIPGVDERRNAAGDVSDGDLKMIALVAGGLTSCGVELSDSLPDILKSYSHAEREGEFKNTPSDTAIAKGENKGLVLLALTAKGIIEDIGISVLDMRGIEKKAEPKHQIDRFEKIEDIRVSKGTSREDLPLPKKVKAFLTGNILIEIPDIRWDRSEPEYDPDQAGEYVFEGSYELPQGVEGVQPKLTCKVIVKESTSTPDDKNIAWAREKMNLIAEYYDSMKKTSDWWKIAEIGKLGKSIKPEDLEFVYRETFPDGELNNKPFIGRQGALLKAILALRATGYDPENYYGYNLVEELCKENLDMEGSNIWHITSALFALSSDDYEYSGLQTKREELIKTILSLQKQDGLWASTQWGWQDETGFALYALAPYYSRPEIKTAVEKAVDGISKKQLNNGGLTPDPGNSNSLSMVAGGLWSCDPNYLNDPRLVKNGKSMLDELKSYDIEGKPEFLWKKDSKDGKPMATEQAFRAIVAYFSMKGGKGYIFDYKDKPKKIATDKYVDKVELPWRKAVSFGTMRSELDLPKTAELKISGGEKRNVDLIWDNGKPNYDPYQSGTYVFTATYSQPAGTIGTLPKAQMRIFVNEHKDDTQEVFAWVKQKMDLIADHYATQENLQDWWKIAEIGKLGKKITPENMEFLFRQTFVNGKLSDDVGVLLKGTLAIRAAGYDPENYYGHNVVEALVNARESRGIWDEAPKLWALTSDDYEQSDTEGEIRELLLAIISKQGSNGLWDSEWGWEDATGFALYALGPYYDEDPFGLGIKDVVEKAVDAISKIQKANGDLKNSPGNSNSLAMVAGGLWSCDPNYLTDKRLVKNGNTLLHALKRYEVVNEPAFRWRLIDSDGNSMATEQALRALITLTMKQNKKGYVFDYRGLPKEVLKNDIIVDHVEKLEDITVAFGTPRENLGLPGQATLVLSNHESKVVDLIWSDSKPNYDGNKAGDYIFEAVYTLPSEVSGDKPIIHVKVTVEDISTALKEITPVAPSFEVIKGTLEDEAKAKLPKDTLILDNKGNYHSVSLEWMIEGYNKDIVAEYPATGTFNLPSEVGQSDPPQELKVSTIVKVVEDPNLPSVNKDALHELVNKIDAEGLEKDRYTPESFERLEQALKRAKELLNDDTVEQDAVNDTLLALQNARQQLQENSDKKRLNEVIEKAKELLKSKDLYEEAGVITLEEELKKAESLYNDPNATQVSVDAQADELNRVCGALRKKNSGGGGSSGGGSTLPSNDITVYFTLRSIERGGTKEEIWVPRQAVTVPKGSKVFAVFDKMMKKYGLEYINKGNYISEILSPTDGKWFGEFSNGKYSGWMYMVNGKHPMFGLEEFEIHDKDEIIWHYTNDYRYEQGSEQWLNENFGGGGSIAKGDTKVKIEVQDGIGKVQTTDKLKKMLQLSIDEVKNLSDDKKIVSLDLRDEKDLKGFEVNLDKEVISQVTAEDKLSLSIKSNVLEMVIDPKALQEIKKVQDKIFGDVKFEAKRIQKAGNISTNKGKDVEQLIGTRPIFDINIKVNNQSVSEYPSGKLTFKMPYTIQKGEDKNKLTVYRIEKDALTPMEDVVFDDKNNTVQFTTDHLSYYGVGLKADLIPEEKVPLASMIKFKDVPEMAWYAKAVYTMAEKNLIRGKEQDLFKPNDKVSRAEFVSILARIDGVDIEKAEKTTFRDVKEGSWYFSSISWAIENNIANGYGKEFRPHAPISREEIAVILVNYSRYNNAIKISEKSAEKIFKDQNKIAPWAVESVKIMQKAEIVGGRENDLFAPKAHATRAEAAEMIYRMIG